MASTVGPRAKGTDGSDFLHRERVATQYKKSAELKPKLKKVLQLQIINALMCLVVGLVVKYDYPCLLCFSGYLCGIPMGFMALSKNNPTYINLYGVCCSLLGVFPMVFLLYLSLWTGAVDQYRYVRLSLAVAVVLVNTYGMFLAKTLMDAWSLKRRR